MALRRTLAKRLFNKTTTDSPSPVTNLHSPLSSSSSLLYKTLTPPNASKLTSPDSDTDMGFFRRFLQRRGIINQPTKLPEFLNLPVGEKLREKLRSSINISGDHRLRLDGLSYPVTETVTVDDARKILRYTQMEKVREKLRVIPANSISYSEFLRVCVEICENWEQGSEFAQMLDQSGNVIVLGNVVFLRPEMVAKSMEKIICESIATPNDPRKKELEKMEQEKSIIDQKAKSLVQKELYGGLSFIVVQTLFFMRLTFWELTWDVMEPICFFFTSLHFALAYAFFLRTSTEPSFQGYFRRRFIVKQKKLMKIHNFDIEKYNQLCKAFYPNYGNLAESGHFKGFDHASESVAFFGSMGH